MKLSSRCVERRGKVGQLPVYLQGVYGHPINASSFRNARASRLFEPATSQDIFLVSILASGSYFALLLAAFPIPLFFIPESTYLSTAAWRFNKRVAYSVMFHSDNSRQSCALSLRLYTSIRQKLPGIYFCKPKRHLLHAAPSNVFSSWGINSGPGSACFLYNKRQSCHLASRAKHHHNVSI